VHHIKLVSPYITLKVFQTFVSLFVFAELLTSTRHTTTSVNNISNATIQKQPSTWSSIYRQQASPTTTGITKYVKLLMLVL